ncbi:MAG TPA: SprT family zinc-dependent metalloprotease [bacterium]|nr:SprT family zinc-dependent metalloprotease [bacterium]HOL34946.1 SprT family zinc-dependent metalloprotease [bacterium]HPP09111.1 SprT family zinc-dependent metalloprotease [bacterium]HXK44420.1 SprT family zinc-dependent metalloprotease [bacterium]
MQVEIEKIIRSKRKTIALQVTDDATLIVRAPFETSEQTIRNVVLKHVDWIERKRKEILARDPGFVKKEFVNGEGFLYLGRSYRLTIVKNQNEPLIFNNGFFLLKDYQPVAYRLFVDWYKEKSYEKISERAAWFARQTGYAFNTINITNAFRRWGSCSSKGNLNFSWRLIMAPLSVVDYVVVHELVHIEEKNHTKIFWNKVKALLPNYEQSKDWLKKYGYLLRL